MAVFEMESWFVAEGKEKEHAQAMRGWLQWVNNNRELFVEWKSVRYFYKKVAGEESGRFFIIWEYDSLAAFEEYKAKRSGYKGLYAEYKKYDPYCMDVFNHHGMKVEFWSDEDRDLWIEQPR